MKKFLSLALALVMTMSLVTISAGATFTDDSTINYSEAVDVMTALEIVGGYANGSFGPEATLTRGAAAKIICNLIEGGDATDVVEGTYKTMLFSDVALNHTFADYIGYCANKGIISGYEDGTFRPAGTITGFAFMKMLLGALGYDSAVEGFTGDGWAVNVSSAAKKAKLDNGNEDYTGSKAMTREEACLYAFNTLKANIVEYKTAGTTITTTDGTVITTGGSTASKVEIEDDVYQTFRGEYYSKLDITDKTEDAFGRPASEWKYDKTSVGTYVDTTNLVASFEGKVTEADLHEEIINKKTDSYTVNYNVDQKEKTDTITINNDSTDDDAAVVGSCNGSITELYFVEGEEADSYLAVTINTYLVKATADYDDDDEVLAIEAVSEDFTLETADKKLSSDDFAVTEFEEDDYILVTVADDKIQSVEAAEVIEGEADSYADGNVTIDGTKYSYSAKAAEDTAGRTYAFEGEEYMLVLDGQGNVMYVEGVEGAASTDYVFIASAGQLADERAGTTVYYSNAAYFADGTKADIDVVEFEDEEITSASADGFKVEERKDGDTSLDDLVAPINTWYAYTVNADSEYSLEIIKDGAMDEDAGVEYDIKTGAVKYDNANKGNNDTLFIINDGDDVFVYTGIKNVPNVEGAVSYSWIDDGFATLVYVDATADDAEITTDSDAVSDYMYVLKLDSKRTTSEGKISVYKAIIDGEVATFETLDHSDIAADLYDSWEVDADGYYTVKAADKVTESDTDVAEGGVAATTVDFTSGVLTLDEVYSAEDDIAVWVVNGDAAEKVAVADLADYLEDEEITYVTYIALTDKDDSVALSLYVEKAEEV